MSQKRSAPERSGKSSENSLNRITFLSPTQKNEVKIKNFIVLRSRDSSVGIATGYELDGWGSIPRKPKRFFYSP
jgi:hypothetical protein